MRALPLIGEPRLPRLYAGKPGYPAVLVSVSHPRLRMGDEAVTIRSGADNQQETRSGRCSNSIQHRWRIRRRRGCFSVSISPRPTARVDPRMATPTCRSSRPARAASRCRSTNWSQCFDCGTAPADGTTSSVRTVRVDVSLRDLETRVFPFFQQLPAAIGKRDDFDAFAVIVRAMAGGSTSTRGSAIELVRSCQAMNIEGTSKYLRILRDCTPGTHSPEGEDTVRSSWRHGSQAEMT